ncbi:LacI family DNA-binding transcriptional regulator [Streptomyces sp. NPDC059455]|uniref:LacI family DNA-binding transcriptional regulator n=1 Tax=Streptomyces sp. NPDC059455 TaxID=3346837 RepID=UPI0036CBC880
MTEEKANKAPTIIDIAREARVSKSAVSRALLGQGRISEEARSRILDVAQRLGYVKNAMAQGLVAQRTHTLGVLVRDAVRPFYGQLHAALQGRAIEGGYRVVTATGVRDFALAEERRALQTLLSLRVEGLVVCSGLLPARDIAPFVERVPTVVAGRPEPHPAISSVYCDEEDGAEQLVDHLVSLGHRRVAVLLVPEALSITQYARTAAMVSGLRERGVDTVVTELVDGPEAPADTVPALLEDREITAIMCPQDDVMVSVLERLRRAGVRVPDDMSVTGFDGIGPLTTPLLGLTTLRQPLDEVGRRAIDLLLELREDRSMPTRHIPLRGALVAGTTTAPPPPHPARR